MKITPCYKPKSKEDHVLMIKLLYSLGYKMGDAETPDICAKKYSFSWESYAFLEHPNKFNGNIITTHIKNPQEFTTLGGFIQAAIEWLNPLDITVKLHFGLSATFTKNHVKLDHDEFHRYIAIEDIDTLYKAAQEYRAIFGINKE